MTTTPHVKFPNQFGNLKLPETKEEQLKEFGEYIANDLRIYWNQWKLPLPWSKMKLNTRNMRCPLASMEEIRAYLTAHVVEEVKDLNNRSVYVLRELNLTGPQKAEIVWNYSVKHDELREQKQLRRS